MKRIIAIVAVVALLGAGIGGYIYNKKRNAGALKVFDIDRPDLLAMGEGLGRVDIYGRSADNNKLIKMGTMELVEGSATGLQAWAMPIPAESARYKEVIAKAYGRNGWSAGVKSLPYSGEEEVKAALWPARASNIGIPGTITKVDAAARTLTLESEDYGDIKVVIKDGSNITDSRGRVVAIGSLRKGQQILAVGNFDNEVDFTAMEIEITK